MPYIAGLELEDLALAVGHDGSVGVESHSGVVDQLAFLIGERLRELLGELLEELHAQLPLQVLRDAINEAN